MQLPHNSSQDNSPKTELEAEFEQALAEVEKSLQEVQGRYIQIQQDKQRQAQLKHRLEDVKAHLRPNSSRELTVELRNIKEEIEALDNALGLMSQSCLTISFLGGGFVFSKTGLQSAFWQIIRFGGLGVIIGWILKSVVG